MGKSTTVELIEATLSKLQAARWEDNEQVLYDYPNRQANPHLHFAFDSADIAEAAQVTVTLLSRGDNFRRENEAFFDLHLTPLGAFPIDGFAKFLEGLLSAKILK